MSADVAERPSPRPLPVLRSLLLALLTGALLAGGQMHLQPLAWVALAPLALATAGQRLSLGALYGFVAGLVAGAAFYGVLPYGVDTYIMLIVYCGLHMAAFGVIHAWAFGRVHPALDAALPAIAWTAFEFLRRVGTLSFPVNLAATQVQHLPLIQIAHLASGHAVSFLVALPAGLLATWALRGRLPRRSAVVTGLLLISSLGYGWHRLATAEIGGRPLKVAAVQTGFHNWIYRAELVSPPHKELLHSTLFDLSERAGRRGAQLVVWPETALHDRALSLPGLRRRLERIARDGGLALLAGFPVETRQGLERNSAVLFLPSGHVERYDKRRLAGLAEWRVSPGTRNAPLDGGAAGRLGVMICLESVYPGDARELTEQGAEILVVTTNDAGFLYSPMAGFHGHRSLIRAIESDRYLLHVSQAGPSFVFDPLGRAVARAPIFHRALVEATVARRRARSPYHRSGEWFVTLVFLALALACGAAWRTRRLGEVGRTKQKLSGLAGFS